MKIFKTVAISLVLIGIVMPINADSFDFVDCKHAPLNTNEILVGLATPAGKGLTADTAELETYLATLAADRADITVCSRSWEQLLPVLTPFPRSGIDDRYYGWALLATMVFLTLAIIAITNTRKRRYLTISGMLGFSMVCYGCTIGLLYFANILKLPQHYIYGDQLLIQSPNEDAGIWHGIDGVRDIDTLIAKRKPIPQPLNNYDIKPSPVGETFTVIQPLNFRAGPSSTYTPLRTKPLPKGTQVNVEGRDQPDGEWYFVLVQDGSKQKGWVNRHWLR